MGLTISIIMCLQGRRDEAKQCLQIYVDTVATVIEDDDDDTLYWHCCHQSQNESIKLKKCAGCKINYYCNRTHQMKEWRGRFIGHMMFCPFLNRWRRVKRKLRKGKDQEIHLSWSWITCLIWLSASTCTQKTMPAVVQERLIRLIDECVQISNIRKAD